jgi:bleomycin hydrolase
MGANQSKTPLANEKLVIDQLRALEIKDQSDCDYIQVNEKAVVGSKKTFRAPWTALSASDIEQWEHQLLQDPKNRSVTSYHSPQHRLTD